MAYKSKTVKTLLLILLLWAYPAVAPAVTPAIPAHPSQYVVDLAGVFDAPTEARLNAMLHDLEAKTTAQMVVLTLKSLDGEPIENFSHQTAVKWGIGQKGKDNGVLLTVAVKDHKYRIEVGYGLESDPARQPGGQHRPAIPGAELPQGRLCRRPGGGGHGDRQDISGGKVASRPLRASPPSLAKPRPRSAI